MAEGFRVTSASDVDYSSLLEQSTSLVELEKWLRKQFDEGLPETMRKAEEYGSEDLEIMGDGMARLIPGFPTHDHSLALQAAICFYSLGKVARIMAAIREGRQPGVDSWHDLGVYATMAKKVHETGKWL